MKDDPITRRKFLKAVGAASAVALGAGVLGCVGGKPATDANNSTGVLPGAAGLTYVITGTVRGKFADYVPLPATATPSLAGYAAPADLSGLPGAAGLGNDAYQALASRLFYATPSSDAQIYDVYKAATEAGTPVIVTTDAALHGYHILFDYALRILEVDKLNDAVTQLSGLMQQASLAQRNASVSGLQDLCTRNVAFFAVAGSLLGGSTGGVPSDAMQLANAELQLIDAHAGFAASPIFGRQVDYSQFEPRGHYTRTDLLKQYFKAMMWYGLTSFNLYEATDDGGKTPDKGQTRQAIMITLALQGKAFDLWQSVYDPTVFFVGETDDLSVYDYQALIKEVYGDTVGLSDLADDDKILSFIDRAAALKAPKIISGLIADDQDKDVLRGFRFMGQWYIPDSYIFQELVYDKVGTQQKPRLFPTGLDVMAVLGSQRAYAILDGLGETQYANYVSQFDALKVYFSGLDAEDWTQNLYWGWLYSLLSLLDVKGAGYPSFMQGPAWVDKELDTALGSWMELRHDTILYAKQSYTVFASAVFQPSQPSLPKGYVEPNADLYGRLASLAQMTYDGLNARNLLTDTMGQKLSALHDMLVRLKTISERELGSTALSDDDYGYIRGFGGLLEGILTFPPDMASAVESDTDKDMAVAADVHTDSNTGQVLEETVGHPCHLFVLVPVDGQLTVCKGASFSYYEFKEPMANRLTDEAWQALLANGTAPEPPAWTKSFTI